jgi:hypothetical protein
MKFGKKLTLFPLILQLLVCNHMTLAFQLTGKYITKSGYFDVLLKFRDSLILNKWITIQIIWLRTIPIGEK